MTRGERPRDLPVTAFAVLGQLAHGPASGYDIQARLRATAAHFWHAAYSQIYAELRRLEDLGYATHRAVEQTGRPDKRVYTITPAGRAALAEWLERPWGLAHIRDESLVKLMLAGDMETAAVVEQVRRLLRAHDARRREFEDAVAGLPDDAPPYLRLAMRKGVHAQTAFAAWCREVIHELGGDAPG